MQNGGRERNSWTHMLQKSGEALDPLTGRKFICFKHFPGSRLAPSLDESQTQDAAAS